MVKEIIEKYLTEELTERDLLVENFNEKSFQHKLGEHIRKILGDEYIIQYERNIHYFDAFTSASFFKSEVDIVILKKESALEHHKYNEAKPVAIIEIKFIRQYSEAFVIKTSPTGELKNHFVDIAFCDQLKKEGIEECISLLVSDYAFQKPTKCLHEPLWKAYYFGKIDSILLSDINRAVNSSSSSTYNQKNAVKYLDDPTIGIAWMGDFRWKGTSVGVSSDFRDEKGHELRLKYMLISEFQK